MRRLERKVMTAALLCLLAAMAIASAAPPAVARVQQAPSSRVTLDLPAGFVPSSKFAGFVDEVSGASFLIVEMPDAAYAQLVSGLTPEALATKGLTGARPGRLERADDHLYITAVQKTPSGLYAKYMAAFRQGGISALVTANVPKAALEVGSLTEQDIERALASASVAPVPAPAREVFRLGYLGPFKPSGTVLGTTRAYAIDEPGDSKGPPLATLIVAPSLDRRPVAAPESYAEELLAGLPGLSDMRITDRRRLSVSGLEAIELVGDALDKDKSARTTVYQMLMLPPGGGYYRLVGQLPEGWRERLLPELRRIAEGFQPVE
jgi:hypothetical protein